MQTNLAYDAKVAYHHIAALAFPRAVGSPGEVKARDYIVEQFAALGMPVSREPFSFTKFPSETLPRLLCGLAVPVVVSVPWFGERVPIPVCIACLLLLSVLLLFTQWQKGLEGMYNIGREHRSENLVATNGLKPNAGQPAFLFVAHYDSKSQVLPIAVRAVSYVVVLVGLVLLTFLMLLRVSIAFWLPEYFLWGLSGIICACVFLVQINFTQNRSPGGFDNASGVGVMLEVARTVMARRVKKSVTFLAAGAEEYGMCGALRYIQTHVEEYDPENTYVINLDGLGVGNGVSLVTRYGFPPVRTARSLADLFLTASRSTGVPVAERYLPIGVGLDSIPIASRGFETVTLTAKEIGSAALRVHSAHDRSDRLRVSSLQQVGDLIVDVIERA